MSNPTRSLAMRTLIMASVATLAILVGIPALVGGLRTDPRVAAAPSGDPTHGITVHGTGRVILKPDLATIIVGVNAQGTTAAQAQASASKAMTGIIAAVKKLGVADKDIATQAISLSATYDYQNGSAPPRVTGYMSAQTLVVKVRNLDKAGEVIDAAVAAGANQVSGVSFSVDDPTAATEQARQAAVADAKKRAQTLASAAGVTLGAPISITEGSATAPPPIFYARDSAVAGAPAQKTPIEVGTTEVTVDVEMVFSI